MSGSSATGLLPAGELPRNAVQTLSDAGSVRRPRRFGRGVLVLIAGLLGVLVAAAAAVVLPGSGALLVAAALLGMFFAVLAVLALNRWPHLVPWGIVGLFSLSAELRLRVSPALGTLKDAFVVLLVIALGFQLARSRAVLARIRPLRTPFIIFGILAALYVVDAAGTRGSGWLFGTRLLFEVFALFILGLLCLQSQRTVAELVRAFSVILPFEAVVAWGQQYVGADALVYRWGYEYGAQVRSTSGGGLRTSGTFEDPFQLAALAVIGLGIALVVASWKQAVVIGVAAVAVLGATSVRTAMLQAGILVVIFAIRRGYARQAIMLGAIGLVSAVLVLAGVTTAIRPGAPQEPILLTLNGRSTAWAQAIQGPESLIIGNGVGALGIGSTNTLAVTSSPSYDPDSAPVAVFAGDSAFLDSAYAQVQSDVGIVGSTSLIAGIVALFVALVRRIRLSRVNGAAWAAVAVLVVSAVDWIGRASLASYTTGFLTTYILGVLVAGAVTRSADSESSLVADVPAVSEKSVR